MASAQRFLGRLRERVATLRGIARSLAVYYAVPRRRGPLRRFYGELIRPGDLAFDIGAHVGNRTRALRGAGARVVAVEPQPAFARFLSHTLPRSGVTLDRRALGRTEGRAQLNVSRRHPTVSTLSQRFIAEVKDDPTFRAVVWDETVEVEVTTLDRLIERHGVPQFCKIDVEGMEAEILAGLSQPIPLVAFEYLPAAIAVPLACIDRLEALGRYRYNIVSGEGHRLDLAEWQDAAGMRATLEQRAREDGSGDVYARLSE